MNAKVFVDSNVWLYALFSRKSEEFDLRHQRATDLLEQLARPAINSQVVREVCSNLIKKADTPELPIRKLVAGWYSDCEIIHSNPTQFLLASQLREKNTFSYWDSLIVAAALEAGCTTLYSEDMQHGQQVQGLLTIVNPFFG